MVLADDESEGALRLMGLKDGSGGGGGQRSGLGTATKQRVG